MKEFWKRNGKIIMPAIITILASYTGYGEYEKRQAPPPAVTVNVESMPTQSPHPDVRGMIRRAMDEHQSNYH